MAEEQSHSIKHVDNQSYFIKSNNLCNSMRDMEYNLQDMWSDPDLSQLATNGQSNNIKMDITEGQNPEHRGSTFKFTNMFEQPIKSVMTTSNHIISKSTFKVTLQSKTSKLRNQKPNRATKTITTYLSSEVSCTGLICFDNFVHSIWTTQTNTAATHTHPLLHIHSATSYWHFSHCHGMWPTAALW